MKSTLSICLKLGLILIFTVSPCFSEEVNTTSTESSKYLDAVCEFADNVLRYGRDRSKCEGLPLRRVYYDQEHLSCAKSNMGACGDFDYPSRRNFVISL